MTDPTVTRVAHAIARRWLTQPVEAWDLARTRDGHLVTADEVEAELARIADQLGAARPVVALDGTHRHDHTDDTHQTAEVTA